MSKRTERQTKVADLHQGDTVKWSGFWYTITRNIPERDGSFTLQLQVPGFPVQTIRDADPKFMVTRIGY